LIWHDDQTGDVAVWLMDGASVAQIPVVSVGIPLRWQIVGVGDVDGDGKADLVWRDSQTGDVAVWLLNGGTVKQSSVVSAGVPLTWQIVGVGDVNGDGRSDLVWRQTQTSDVAVWFLGTAPDRHRAAPRRDEYGGAHSTERRGVVPPAVEIQQRLGWSSLIGFHQYGTSH